MRNNQRNCRARQKAYIRDLEQKVQHYETTQNAQLDDLQKKIDLLSVENQLLKYFVESIRSMVDLAFASPLPPSCEAFGATTGSEVGLDLLQSSGYSTASNSMPSVSSILYMHTVMMVILSNRTQAMSGLQGCSSINRNSESLRGESMTALDTCLPESLLFDDQFLYPSQLPTSMSETLESLHCPLTELGPYNSLSSKEFELPALGCPAMDCNSRNSDLISQPTVSCSEACELLISYVRRKPDLMSLHLRLRDGYRNSLVPGEGCRVDYHVLLTVLSDAS